MKKKLAYLFTICSLVLLFEVPSVIINADPNTTPEASVHSHGSGTHMNSYSHGAGTS
jgi:hypothetical protein